MVHARSTNGARGSVAILGLSMALKMLEKKAIRPGNATSDEATALVRRREGGGAAADGAFVG